MAVPLRALLNSFISTLRIRFLLLVVFSVRSSIFSEHCRKNSVNQRPLKSKAEVWTPIVDLLIVKDGKEGQNASQKNPDRACLKGQLNTRCSGGRNKEQGSCTGILSRGDHRQSKPEEGKVEVRDLRGILVGSSRAQSQAVGRSIYIYIYIANGESPSQHVTVGLAEARPNYIYIYISRMAKVRVNT